MWLWNALMPAIFKLPEIGFWQAIGLLVLAQILFKGGHAGRAGRGTVEAPPGVEAHARGRQLMARRIDPVTCLTWTIPSAASLMPPRAEPRALWRRRG